ncbi:MAG: 4-hydroxy-tetrahydrodipicolinate reductase [Candidatus Omnitrophota bacterium]
MISNKIIRIAVSGCCGKMGKRISSLAVEDKKFFLAVAIDEKKHSETGRDFGEYLGGRKSGVLIQSDCRSVLESADVLIEFSTVPATMSHLDDCVSMGKPLVIGTTALTAKDEKKIELAAQKIPIVKSSNMSLGVNLLFKILKDTVRKMGSYYDIEIIEAHHNQKKDAPSGTALSMAKIICDSLGLNEKKALRFGRHGISGPRSKKEIAVHAIRGGEIVGDHTILFAGKGENIEFTHRALSRDTFAKGALLAARFICDKKKGLYNMQDVLEIQEDV